MATDNSIRLTARGEFGELQRGLKTLKRDLDGVIGSVDRGARRGGFFDQDQLRSFDLFKNRFKQTMDEINREFERQNNIIDRLHQKMQKTKDPVGKFEIQEIINQREKELDVIRKKLQMMEKLNEQYSKEASSFETRKGREGSSGRGRDSNTALGSTLGALGSLGGAGRMLLGLAGIGGVMSLIHQAYNNAYERQVGSLDLAQRMRGYGGRTGSAVSMYNTAGNTGMRDKMGYSDKDTWQFLDTYTQLGGGITGDQQYKLQKFARSYGLDLNTVGATMGQARQLGIASPEKFADQIAGAVEYSGMTPRIMEVMETSVGLLQTINTTIKDGDARTVLKYQATLDKIGNTEGMTKLTGKQGGNIISGLHGMFDDGNENNLHFTMAMLQRSNPEKYGNMDYWDLRMAATKGLDSSDNLGAWWQGVQQMSGGDKRLQAYLVQQGLSSGGMKLNLNSAYEMVNTGVMDKLAQTGADKGKIQETINAIQSGDSGANYDKYRKDSEGQNLQSIEAKFQRALADIGDGFVKLAAGIKTDITNFLNWMTPTFNDLMGGISEWVDKIKEKLGLGGISDGTMILGGLLGASMLPKLFGLLGKIPGLGGLGGGAAGTGAAGAGTGILARLGLGGIGLGGAGMAIAPLLALLGMGTLGMGTLGYVGHQSANDTSKSSDVVRSLMDMANNGELSISNLDETGIAHLQNLQENGHLALGAFSEDGSVKITALRKQGAEELEKLYKEGTISITGMSGNTKKEMEKIVKTHTDGWATITKRWEEIADWFQTKYGGGTSKAPAWGAVAFTEGYDVRSNSGITAAQLDDRLGGQLAGQGQAFIDAGKKHGIDPLVLAAIAMHETDNGSVLTGNSVGNRKNTDGSWMTFGSVGESIDDLAKYLGKYYTSKGDVTLSQIGRSYAPTSESADNAYWATGVATRMRQFDVAPKGSFFRGWGDKVTSGFRSLGRPGHNGLDLGGEQGQILDALAGGTIKKIVHDPDNKTPGGSYVVVDMGDGREYSYSHLSHINPDLQEGMQINRGMFIGRMGGAPNQPGSGTSTTGSHLHLGYKQNGDFRDPAELLSFMLGGAGNSTAGMDVLSEIGKTVTNNVSIPSDIKISVDVNLKGESVEKLNDMKHYELITLIQSVIENAAKTKLQLNPSFRM